MTGRYVVRIRRDIGRAVRATAEQLEGRAFYFTHGWTMDAGDPYPGEAAMIPHDESYPRDAPIWIASGDLAPE